MRKVLRTEDAARYVVTIDRVENLGADTLVYGSVNEGTQVVAKIASTLPFSASSGDKKEFAVNSEHLRYFDPETGLITEPGM